MATKTFYQKAVRASGGRFASLQDGGSIPAASTVFQWNTPGTPTTYAEAAWFYDGTTSGAGATSGASSTAVPDSLSTPGTYFSNFGDTFRSENSLSGEFASGNWTIFTKLTLDAGLTASLRVRLRVWRSADPDGVGATEITSSTQVSDTRIMSGTAINTATITWNAPDFFLANEYLFYQIGIEELATNNTGTPWRYLLASGATTTTNFTASTPVRPVGVVATAQLGTATIPNNPVDVSIVGVSATAALGVVAPSVVPPRDAFQGSAFQNSDFQTDTHVYQTNAGITARAVLGTSGAARGAFQRTAFQNSAYQTTNAIVFGVICDAFQHLAFQRNAFQTAHPPGTSVNVTGVSATAQVGSPVAGQTLDVSVTGFQLVASIYLKNSPFPSNFKYEVGYPIAGLEATAEVGTTTPGTPLILTGVVATTQVGTVVAQYDLSFSLPRGLYDLRPARALFNAPALQIDSSPAASGLVVTAAVGSVVYESSVNSDALEATAALGDLDFTIDSHPAPAGLSVTATLGLIAYKFSYALTGVAATPQVGTVVAHAPAWIAEPSVESSASVGTVSFIIDCNVYPTGLTTTARLGVNDIRIDASVAAAGLASIGQVGTTVEESAYSVLGVQGLAQVGTTSPTDELRGVEGVRAFGQVGAVTTHNDYSVRPTGLSATGFVGAPEFPHLVPPGRGKMVYTRAPRPGH